MIPINWRRGLFRLWIAASVVWLVGTGALLQEDIRGDVSTLTAEPPANPPPRSTLVIVIEARKHLTFAVSVILLPPILLFALGWAGLWIVRGFRP